MKDFKCLGSTVQSNSKSENELKKRPSRLVDVMRKSERKKGKVYKTFDQRGCLA